MNGNMFKLIIMLAVILLTGCASMNGLVTQNTNPLNGAPVQYWKPSQYEQTGAYQGSKSRGEIIAQGVVENIELLFRDVYSTHFDDSSFDVELKEVGNEIEIDMAWRSPSAFFPLGKYDIREIAYHSGGEGLAFVDLVAKALRMMTDNLNRAGVGYRLVCIFYGQADGVPIRGRLIYKGEYGLVAMSQNTTRFNGTSHDFFIEPGQQLSNPQLAALRAYSLSTYMHQLAPDLFFEDQFEVSVVNQIGYQFRHAKVSIEIRD